MGQSKRSRARHNHEEHIDETWLIPYSDLLTLLLALFIVLFAASQVDQRKFEAMMQSFNQALSGGVGVMDQLSPTPPIDQASMTKEQSQQNNQSQVSAQQVRQRNLKALQAQIDKYIAENKLSAQVTTRLDQTQLMIVIRDYALFDSGSAAVKPESRQLGLALSELLVRYQQFEVMVAGHTDNQPIRNSRYKSNWNLSTDRALNFMEIILSNPNLSPKKFRAVGFGEQRPIDTNGTEAGRSKNRRVEVSIF